MNKENGKFFTSGIDYYKLFWVFIIGSFLGVVFETLFCLITSGYIQSRQGVIYGPFNQVYGFGFVITTLVLCPISHKKWYIIFIYSMILGGGIEFLCSFIQQFTTGTISWQYQQLPFNLYGRTSLMYSFFWGILGLFWVKSIYPLMSKFIDKIPNKMGALITWILIVFMVFNMTITTLAVNRWDQRNNGMPAKGVVSEFLDIAYPDSLLQQIYPNLMHVGPPQ